MNTQTKYEGSRRRGRRATVLGAAMLFAIVSTQSHAAHIQFQPEKLVFQSLSQTIILHLTKDGKPLPVAEMGEIKLMINDHDYDEFIDVKRIDGGLVITPTNLLNTGKYELYVGTAEHRVMIPMEAPLETIPNSLEILAERQNKSIEEVKREMGFVTTSPRHAIGFSLPEHYYLGQEMRIQMSPPPDRVFAWHVNGVEVASGYGPHTFRYTFYDEGSYHFRYTESMNGEPVSEDSDFTTVSAEAPIPWSIAANREFELKAPEGYAQHAWVVDGYLMSIAPTLTMKFDKTGPHVVECYATTPAMYGQRGEYRKITYNINVSEAVGP